MRALHCQGVYLGIACLKALSDLGCELRVLLEGLYVLRVQRRNHVWKS